MLKKCSAWSTEEIFLQDFRVNSEASASELLVNLEEILPFLPVVVSMKQMTMEVMVIHRR